MFGSSYKTFAQQWDLQATLGLNRSLPKLESSWDQISTDREIVRYIGIDTFLARRSFPSVCCPLIRCPLAFITNERPLLGNTVIHIKSWSYNLSLSPTLTALHIKRSRSKTTRHYNKVLLQLLTTFESLQNKLLRTSVTFWHWNGPCTVCKIDKRLQKQTKAMQHDWNKYMAWSTGG